MDRRFWCTPLTMATHLGVTQFCRSHAPAGFPVDRSVRSVADLGTEASRQARNAWPFSLWVGPRDKQNCGIHFTRPKNVCGSKPMVPSWGRCATHFRTYFSGWIESDVHWGPGKRCDSGFLAHGRGSLGCVHTTFFVLGVARPTPVPRTTLV